MAFVSINNRSICKITLFDGVAEIPLEGLFTAAEASYSPLSIPQQGVVYMNGSISLTQSNQSIDFDDRFSSFWKRGNRILFSYARPEEPANEYPYPIVGNSYIVSTQYDFKSSLQIDLGCILALLQRRTPVDLGICIDVGQELAVSTAAIELLKAAGIPSDGSDVFAIGVNQIDTSSFTNLLDAATVIEPFSVDTGQSIIDAAANLVAPFGCFFYQGNDGLVRLTRWSDLSNKALVLSKRARDLHVYERNGSLDTMTKKIVATYDQLTLCEENTTQNQEVINGNTRTTVEVIRDDVNRQILRTTREYRTVGGNESLVSRSTETATYESEPVESQTLIKVGQALPNGQCFPPDSGRLLTKVTETVIDNGQYLAEWLANKNIAGQPGGSGVPSSFAKAAGLPDPEFPIAGVSTNQITTETWNYESDVKIVRTIEVQAPQGKVVPLTGDLKFGQTDPRAAASDRDPNSFTIQRLTTEIYTRSDNACEGWKQTIDVREPAYVDDPETINSQAPDQTTVLEDVAENSYLLVQTSFTTNNNIGEPSPETFPPVNNIGRTQVELIFGSDNPNFPYDVTENIFLGSFYTFPLNEINKLAPQIMDLNNGRILGNIIADSPFEIDLDCWVDVAPLAMAKVIEPYRNRASIFTIDSPSITINPSEIVIGFLGIFLGFQDDQENINNKVDLSFTRSPNMPPSDPEAITVASLTLPATTNIEIERV